MNSKRGRLKIYLGFAPGVGKTYKMLREAIYLKNQHYDVVIGWLEENYRLDTIKFSGELETIQPVEIEYKENTFREMDVDGIVKRQPYLVLVDELAHSNRPGSIHEKRFQDVEYLRDHGIHVMTTLNIQHVEGVRDAAARITRTNVTETVPDWVLDHADEVELVDVSPRILQQRLKEGKIFPAEMVTHSTYALFSVNKLLALRELALRYVADEVDDRLEDYRQRKGILNGVPVHERVLVCVNSPATSQRLIATGANLARRLMGELLVLYVQVDCGLAEREEIFEMTADHEPSELTRLFQEMTDKYNGRFLTAKVCGKSKIAFGINRVIREKKITEVVIGESGISRWREIWQGSIITKIMIESRNVNILVAANREGFFAGREKEKTGISPLNNSKSKMQARLKIYIGAAAGVGKTVAMLREGHELKDKGVNILIGVIETHKRPETAEYVSGLEAVPLKETIYRGVTMNEMDVQGIIERKPKVVLIDELAHTNVPGSKNSKRYHDVQEILNAGIDVISAINIQHIESLNDIVESVTGVKVKETVPDVVIARADEIVMIDITPESLRQRLKTGKVYAGDKIEQALNSFFRQENLQALRELALREVAQDIEDTHKGRKSDNNQKAASQENVLVCIQARVEDERLIRRGFKIAQRLKADLHVLHICDGHRYSMAESQQIDLLKDLAERLGAVVTIEMAVSKRQVKTVMLNSIHHKSISRLVIGQSARTRWEEITNGSIVNDLLKETKGVDILIVADPYRKELC
jgi:two-component system sensor histidine kinase KdpD